MGKGKLQWVSAYRACKVLFDFLVGNGIKGKVLLPANICTDVVDTLVKAQMQLEWVDISWHTLCMDEGLALSRVAQADVLLFVHTYGVETEYYDFFRRVKAVNPRIIIIDDKCLCKPNFFEKVPEDVDLTLYSTGEKKQCDLGGGGFGLTNEEWATNMDCCIMSAVDIQGMIVRFEAFRESEEYKERLRAIYSEKLPQDIQFLKMFQDWRFNIGVDAKEEILRDLFQAGLFASSHYKPLDCRCGNAVKLYDRIINLFEDRYYTEEMAVKTCEIINRYV